MTRHRKKYTNKAQNNRCDTLLFCRTTQDEKPGNCAFINVGGSWLNPPSIEQIEVLKTAWTVSVFLWLDDRAPPPTLLARPKKESGPRTQQQGLGWSGLNTTTPGRLDELLDLLSYSAQGISIADVTLYINYIFWKDAISFCYLSNCVLHKLHQQRPRFFLFVFFVMQGKETHNESEGNLRGTAPAEAVFLLFLEVNFRKLACHYGPWAMTLYLHCLHCHTHRCLFSAQTRQCQAYKPSWSTCSVGL